MAYRATLHFPEETKECENIYKEIANCGYRYIKTYIDSLNLTSRQAEVVKEYIKMISNSKKFKKDIAIKKSS